MDLGKPGLVGRDSEFVVLQRLLVAVSPAVAGACIEGEAGIGKSMLWRSAAAQAHQDGFLVLWTRPAQAEARYSFAGLRDLLEPVADRILPELPSPQRLALEAALLRTPVGGTRVDHRTVSAAVLNGIRWLATTEPVCIAVDDVQWLDPPTARLLAFTLRRVRSGRVRLLATCRTAPLSEPIGKVHEWLDDGALETIALRPLEAGSVRELLGRRLNHALTPPVLSRVVDAAAGNPLLAVELGRAILQHADEIEPGMPLPVTDAIHSLLHRRLAALPASALHGLRLAAALYRPSIQVVSRAMPQAAASLVAASDAGVVQIKDDQICFAHPLLAALVYRDTPEPRRRWMHRRLAEVVADVEQRARHLALAESGADAGTAEALEEAAAAATRRGAPDAGAELAELAVRLTPLARREDRWRRTVMAADRHFDTGNLVRARVLLEDMSAQVLPGPVESDIAFRLGAIAGYSGDLDRCMRLLRQAAEAARDDAGRRCAAEQLLAYAEFSAADIRSAHQRAVRSLEVAERLGDPGLLVVSLVYVAFLTFTLGGGVRADLFERAIALEEWADPFLVERHPRFLRGAVLRFAGDLDAARQDLQLCLNRFREAGEYGKIPSIAWHLSELECHAGNWELADRLATEATDNAAQSGSDLTLAYALCSRAVIDAHLGRVAGVRAAAERGLVLAARAGDRVSPMWHSAALGFLELSLGNPTQAHAHFGPLTQLAEAAGIQEPGHLHFVPDEIEALIALGRLVEAERLLARFETQARAVGRTWGLATAARCRALLHAAAGDLQAALSVLEEALGHHADLGRPFELGRTLMVQGVVQRRVKQKMAPRESFQQALDIFNRLGATIWAARASRELATTGVRRVAATALSPMESRVAELAAAGHTNREIASVLSIRPKTVEANLGRIYRKLGVRSRTHLARTLPQPVE